MKAFAHKNAVISTGAKRSGGEICEGIVRYTKTGTLQRPCETLYTIRTFYLFSQFIYSDISAIFSTTKVGYCIVFYE